MTRGRIKLKYKGRSDIQLTGNPKICFWKYVYKQHTNFAKQSNQIDYEDTSYMENDCSSLFKFRILRNAELVKFISLKLKLPHIYSHDGHMGEFSWIKDIGANIIEYARLYYDDILIEEIDGDFLITHRDMLLDSDKISNFDKLIGNVPELNNPYHNNVYPSHTMNMGNVDNSKFYIKRDYNTNSSIKEYLLNIPLLFCFFREKSFIPLVSNKLREVFVEIKLRPLKELYTIIKNTDITLNSPIKPSRLFLLDDTNYNKYTSSMILNEFPYGHNQPSDQTLPRWIHLGKDDQIIEHATHTDINTRGFSIAINASGNRVAVGIPGMGHPKVIHNIASVKVYELQDGVWKILGEPILNQDLSGISTNVKYIVSLNKVGNRVAVGIPENSNCKGKVNVYEFDSVRNSWKPLFVGGSTEGTVAVGASDNHELGYSVSLNHLGNKIALGSPGWLNDTGAVAVYEYSPPTDFSWSEKFSIDGALNEFAGQSISFNSAGDRVAIGMPGNDNSVSGKVNIYSYSSNGWEKLGTSISGDQNRWLTGWAVSLNKIGDTVAVATRSRGNTSSKEDSGLVRVYNLSSANVWVQKGVNNMTGEESTSQDSINSISLSDDGNRIAVGRPYAIGGGKVNIYKYTNNNEWSDVADVIGDQSNLTGTDGGDAFGTSVSLDASGNTVAIGIPGGLNGRGIVRVYTHNDASGNIWDQVGMDIIGGLSHDGLGDAAGTEVSINSAGNIVALGLPRNNAGGVFAGAARVYNLSGNSWNIMGNINDMLGPSTNSLAGFSVELSRDGKRLVMGAPNYSTTTTPNAGLIKTYEYRDPDTTNPIGSWVEFGNRNMIGASGGHSGWDVSIDSIGERVASGLKFNVTTTSTINTVTLGNGSVYIYSLEGVGGGWDQMGSDLSGAEANDKAGWSVSLNASGDKVAYGIPGKDTKAGGGVVYNFSGGIWNRMGEVITRTGGADNDEMGWSVSLDSSGNTLAIGCPGGDSNGLVQVYNLSGTSWEQCGSDITHADGKLGDNFGWAVSLNGAGSKLAIGYPNKPIVDTHSSNINNSILGGVTVYENLSGGGSCNWVKTGVNENMTGYVDNDMIGYSVSLDEVGNTVAVGVPHISDQVGFIRVYEFLNKPLGPDYVPDIVSHKKRIPDPDKNIFKFTKNVPTDYFVPNLEVEYIFLDNIERKKFVLENVSQTFTFNKKLTFKNLTGNQKLYINEFHPVKSLSIISKRNDLHNTNEWSNFSNNDYKHQDTRNLQNYFTNLAHKESIDYGNGNTDLIKNLGTFTRTDNPFNCIIKKGRLTDISGDIVKLDGLDFLTSKPALSLTNSQGNTYNIAYDLLLKYLLVVNGGENYIKNPKIIAPDNRIINSTTRLHNGKIQSIQLRDNLVYTDYTEFTVEPQLYCSSINVNKGGNNYKTLPDIYIKDGPRYNKLECTGSIKKGTIHECRLMDNYIVSQKDDIIVGGKLKNISFLSDHVVPDDLSIKFYDPYNKIVEPSIIIDGGNLKIKESGCGLSQYTKVCVGKIISKINIPKDFKLKENIFDYEIVPIFYPNSSKNINTHMRNTKNPQLDVNYAPINKYNLDYKLFFNETYNIDGNIINFNKCIANKRLGINMDYSNIPPSLRIRDLYLTFYTVYGPRIINLGNITNITDVSIRIIHNLKYDVTNKFKDFEIKSIKCGGLNQNYIMINPHKSFSEINIKNNDILTLYINEIEITTTAVKKCGDILIGLDNNTPNFKDIKNYNNVLLFGNFTNKMYGLEFGKTISTIELRNVDNIDGISVSNNTNFSINLNELKHKIIKHDCSKILDGIEYDYGGGRRQLNNYVTYEIINGFLNSIKFNENYYLSDNVWGGYTKAPTFILKNTAQRNGRRQVRDKLHLEMPLLLDDLNDDNFQDALVEGVLDYGGVNFKGKIVDNNSGFEGYIKLDKITSNIYNINFINPGYNYDEGLLCTLISYRIVDNIIYDLNILEQYDVKINVVGQIDFNNKVLWKNGSPVSNIEIIWDKSTKGTAYHVYNPNHNIDTQYKLILGNIPSNHIMVMDYGTGFDTDTGEIAYKTSGEEQLFKMNFNYFTQIKKGGIHSISIDNPEINGFKIPLLGFAINNNKLTTRKQEFMIETAKQLTGFKIIDKGYNLNNDSKLYNGFVTKLPNIETATVDSVYFTSDTENYLLNILDDRLEFNDENKFTVTNGNYNYSLLDYLNIKIDNKTKNNTIGIKTYLPHLSEIKQTDKTTNTIIVELEDMLPIFTGQSEVFFSTDIADINIVYPGNELDNNYSMYKLLLKNANNEIINVNNNILVEFEGYNTDIKNNFFDIEIEGDGGGKGALIEPFFKESSGATVLSIMAINESKLENNLSEYDGNDLNLNIDNLSNNTELRHLSQNIYGWEGIDRGQLISQQDTIDLDSIRKFMDTWRYRQISDIPILNKNNYDFYRSSNAIKKMGLSIDFKEREAIRDIDYYRYLEKYFTMRNPTDSDIILYSFCLDNNRLQPNGNINLSSLDNLCVDLELKNPQKDTQGKENYKYNVSVFLKCYNVIDYINGAGGLKYGN